jgi:hypothetical protein
MKKRPCTKKVALRVIYCESVRVILHRHYDGWLSVLGFFLSPTGTFALMSLLLASALDTAVPLPEDYILLSPSEKDAFDEKRANIAVTIAFCIGILQVCVHASVCVCTCVCVFVCARRWAFV